MRENNERWKPLREKAAKEQDPRPLLELTREIDDLLLVKQRRLERLRFKSFVGRNAN